MNRFMRRIATVGAFAAIVGGTLLATGGYADAATPQASGDHPARVSVVKVHHRTPADPWIADQLEMSDPWIMDQLASLPPTGITVVAVR